MSRILALLVPLLATAPALAGGQPPRATIEFGAPSMWGNPAFWVFLVLAAGSLGLAIFTITRRNAVMAVVGLVGSFFCLAGIYVLLYAHFLAVMQILVYAGAIMVLFVFVIMVLGREESEPWALRSLFTKVVGVCALFLLGYVVLRLVPTPALAAKGGAPPTSFGTVGAFGDVLFKEYLFPFEAVSLLLLLAVIGAIVIARGKRAPRAEDAPAPGAPKESR
ncbi:MAG: NADH-quinone oxidoreductase subunit J [Deltaproteobacteria bacterium]|nr:NADH-quinone oxidoreductase subunit J [Deltaproteobacteria bacterium]